MWNLILIVGLAVVAEPKPVGAAKVFEGDTGEKVTVVYLEPKSENHVLIAFEGVDGEWDGQVLEHERVAWGDKEDFKLLGKGYVSLVQRNGRFEAYPKGGKNPIHVRYSKEASAATKPEEIVARFLAQKEKSK